MIDIDASWAAFERRDRSWDGRVIGAVKTTGIYCKPSCPARRPDARLRLSKISPVSEARRLAGIVGEIPRASASAQR